jgi:hypothetical protein
VFPWYMSIILSPFTYLTMYYVRNPYLFAILAARTKSQCKPRFWYTNHCDGSHGTPPAKPLTELNVPLALLSELRYGWHIAGLPGFDTVCFPTPLSSPSSYPDTPSDALDNPAMHAAFLSLLVISVLALICTEFCNPGICATLTKDTLKPVRSISPKNVYERVSYKYYFI